jgi:phenylacetate-CoA ligase
MKSFIARKISLPLQDISNGTHILNSLDDLRVSQYWEREKLQSYQFEKFLKLLNHAVKNAPYYSELFREHNLTVNDIRTPDDIQKIPILTKETAREQNQKLIARNLNWKKIHKGVTGGTTGPPLKLLRDIEDRSLTWAAYYRWYDWMDIRIGDRFAKVWGTPMVLNIPVSYKIKSCLKEFYYNRKLINSFQLNESTIPAALKEIEEYKPVFIRGYLSAFIQLSEYIIKNNIQLSYKPKALSTTTETLLPPYKKLVEKAFNSKLYDQYGCGECNSMAFDAGDGNGLYIAMEHCLLEIIDETGNQAGLNNGRFVLTNLDSFAMPFIRYENGDTGSFAPGNQSAHIKLQALKQVTGRKADTITLKDGSKVHGVFFTDILNELFEENPANIHRFQVYQNEPGKVEFRIESKENLPKQYTDKLNEALYRYLKHVSIVSLVELPKDASGKFRYVVNETPNP